MPMKVINLLYLFVSLLMLSVFPSCSDDDDVIKVYYNFKGEVDPEYTRISRLDTKIGGFQLRVKGGSGEYTAYSEDPSVLNYFSSNKEEYSEMTGLNFSTYKVGSTTVRITDSENNSVKITINVSAKSRPMDIEKVEAVIEGADEETVEEIEEDALKTQMLKEGSTIDMNFSTVNSGIITVIPGKDADRYEGTFTIDNPNVPLSVYTLEYNDEVHTYKVSGWEKSTKALGPVPLMWTEDLTKAYKEKYPDLSFDKVEYKMYIYAYWY